MRTLYVELELNEKIADAYAEKNGIADSAPIAYLEHEIGWLAPSGFTLINAFIADADDTGQHARYINYIAGWAMEGAEDCDLKDSPMSYEEWLRANKKLTDSSHDMGIMNPEMIRNSGFTTDLWIVREDWAINGIEDSDTHFFLNRESAELHIRGLINEFFTYDNPASWRTEPNFGEEAGELYYKAWLDGDYRENHYEVAIMRKTMDLTWDYIHKVGQMNNESYAKEDMLTRITEEDSEIEATDEERQRLIELVNNTDVEGLIEDKLGSADSYWERYWSAVNDVARDLLKEIRRQDE